MREEGPNNSTTVLKDKIASGTYQNATANLEASGAVPLTIHELIDTKVAGLELPDDLRLLTGVVTRFGRTSTTLSSPWPVR